MKRLVTLRDKDDQHHVISWWNSLHGKDPHTGKSRAGLRAELRRSETPADVLLAEGFRTLFIALSGSFWSAEDNILGLAAMAGVLSHIETNDQTLSFAAQCAVPRDGASRAPVSELRFSQLQKSRSIDELFVRMRRTVSLLLRQANVLSVADSVLHWYREHELGADYAAPRDKILVRWGLEYFQHVPVRTQQAIK